MGVKHNSNAIDSVVSIAGIIYSGVVAGRTKLSKMQLTVLLLVTRKLYLDSTVAYYETVMAAFMTINVAAWHYMSLIFSRTSSSLSVVTRLFLSSYFSAM